MLNRLCYVWVFERFILLFYWKLDLILEVLRCSLARILLLPVWHSSLSAIACFET